MCRKRELLISLASWWRRKARIKELLFSWSYQDFSLHVCSCAVLCCRCVWPHHAGHCSFSALLCFSLCEMLLKWFFCMWKGAVELCLLCAAACLFSHLCLCGCLICFVLTVDYIPPSGWPGALAAMEGILLLRHFPLKSRRCTASSQDAAIILQALKCKIRMSAYESRF